MPKMRAEGVLITVSLACLSLLGLFVSSELKNPAPALAMQSSGTGQSAAQMDLVHQGKLIFDETPNYAGEYVGDKLSCSNCHLKSGTVPFASPMIDISGLFPMFNQRAGHIISLKNRIQECFARSQNGKPLPEDSKEMVALVAYIDWLSRDEVKDKPYKGRGLVKLPALIGDPVNGKVIYASQCAICHGSNGVGAPPALPPLWGADSFNDGAGMHDTAKMAAFVVHNMPQNNPGSLTPQQAYDVAAFIHTMPRPQFNQAYKSY
jgi:thiosulfate dehydrogenase